MSVLILNRFPSRMARYKEWLWDFDGEINLFTSQRTLDEFDGFNVIQGYAHFQNNANVEIDAELLFQKAPFSHIVALDETEIVRAALLRQRFGINGQHYSSALAFRDKVLMKDQVCRAGVPTPKYLRVHHPLDVWDFITHYGYPVVLKPVDGFGSIGVKVVKSEQELRTILQDGLPSNYEVEQFVDGPMYTIDGLVIDRTVSFVSSTKYVNGCLDFDTTTGYVVLHPQSTLLSRFKEFITKVFSAMPTPDHCSFHCEVFLTSDDKIVFCEIACRTGGGMIDEAILRMYGVDLNGYQTRLECALPVPVLPQSQHIDKLFGTVMIPRQARTLVDLPMQLPFDWVELYMPNGKVGTQYTAPQSYLDNVGTIMVSGRNEAVVEDRLNEATAWFNEHVIWKD
uniref:ATP-grasp superfamily putative amino acid ligase n=2 Tax=Sulfobacillus thermotolerans TaxID=338644 RepID=G5CJ35_9FIRM|nr:ATP-grasp superfamily putative amino acid ligase [Sulfobacillus thermotolerans]